MIDHVPADTPIRQPTPGKSHSFALPSCSGSLPISRCFTPLLLLCFACGGGRTALTDAMVAASPSGGDDQSSWDGGLLPPTPGQVRCGSITCGQGEQCCLREEGRPASNGCDSKEKLRDCHGTDYARTCDETADCDAGKICCWANISGPPPMIVSLCVLPKDESRCDYIACGADEDCRALGLPSCIAQRCRGDILQSCGRMPSENFCTP
jgi:hypothetical protein